MLAGGVKDNDQLALIQFKVKKNIMRNLLLISVLALSFFVLETSAQPPAAPKSLPGEVIVVDAANNQLKFKTINGETTVAIDAKTEIKRIAPDKLSEPASAIAVSLSDISVGDKIVAVGVLSDDKKTVFQTRRIFVLTRADLVKKQEADQARWTTRGIAGRVTVLDPAAKTITVAVRGGGLGSERTTIVTTDDKTIFRRYAANSVKFSDAKSSSLSELKVGDQLRAVGEKTSDNAALAAEEILFGSFRMVAGKISAIDVAKNEITVKDLQTNKEVTIGVNGETLLRRFPAEMAQRMAQMQMMRGAAVGSGGEGGLSSSPGMNRRAPQSAGGQTTPPSASQNVNDGMPSAATGTSGGARAGGGVGTRRGDVDSMLEQMPALVLTELKIGDAVAASSSGGESTDRVTAIKFVAGIEPFLVAPQPSAMPGGNRPQSSPSINIPGLDGFGAP